MMCFIVLSFQVWRSKHIPSAFPILALAAAFFMVMIRELEFLHGECRSNNCVEHATGIIEEHKGPEDVTKKVS